MKKLLLGLAAAFLAVVGLTGVVPAYALGDTIAAGTTGNPIRDNLDTIKPSDLPGTTDSGESALMSIVKNIINAVVGVVGVVAVVMMIIGGISFITSQGDTNKVTKARNTILYGVVGLIVALLAFAIVNFVLSGIFPTE